MSGADAFSLRGKTAAVTGAAGGIGTAIARRLASHAAGLVLFDAPEQAHRLDELRASILSDEGSDGVDCVAIDAVDQQGINAWAQDFLGGGGHVDILVTCAAIHRHSLPIGVMSDDEWRRVLDVNFHGPRYMIEALLAQMRQRRDGSVIAIASDSAVDAIAGEAAYGVSKAACIRMMAYLARENMHSGIRFNAIAPGWVKTKLTEPFWSDPAIASEAVAAIPAGRFADPDEIASVVLFLASPLSTYVNGHCIFADGGRVAGNPI